MEFEDKKHELETSGVTQSIKIFYQNYKTIFHFFLAILLFANIMTCILTYIFAINIQDIVNDVLKNLFNLSFTLLIGGFLLNVVSSMYNEQKENKLMTKKKI